MSDPFQTPPQYNSVNPDRNKAILYLQHEAPRPKGRDLECAISVLMHVLRTTSFTTEQVATLVFDYWRSPDFSDIKLIAQLTAEAEARIKNPNRVSIIPQPESVKKAPQNNLIDASSLSNTIVGRLVSAGNGYRVGLTFGLSGMSLQSLPKLDEKVIGPFPAAFENSAKIGLSDGLKILILNERGLSRDGDK